MRTPCALPVYTVTLLSISGFAFCGQLVFPWGIQDHMLYLSLQASWSLVLRHRWLQICIVVSGTGKLNRGRQCFLGSKLIPHLFNHVFIGLDGTLHVNDFVELPREWPITACCKNEMGVVKHLGRQKVE